MVPAALRSLLLAALGAALPGGVPADARTAPPAVLRTDSGADLLPPSASAMNGGGTPEDRPEEPPRSCLDAPHLTAAANRPCGSTGPGPSPASLPAEAAPGIAVPVPVPAVPGRSHAPGISPAAPRSLRI